MNPFLPLAEFPDFASLRPEHAEPAITSLLDSAEAQIQWLEQHATPTWEGYMMPLHEATHELWRAWGIVEHLVSVANSAAWREVEEALQPKIVTFSMRVMQSDALYQTLCVLQKSPHFESLDAGRKRVIQHALLSAQHSGIGLTGDARVRFNAVVQELSACSIQFSNHVLDATKAFSLLLTSLDEVEGLPETIREACADAARSSGFPEASAEKGPWRVTLEFAIYGPFMQYAVRRDLREKLLRAQISKASQDPINNQPLIEKILSLRQEMAQLLGYPHYAALSLSTKMAGTIEPVYSLIHQIRDLALPKAKSELAELQAFAESIGFDAGELRPWDTAFYERCLVESKYGYSPEALRPYFPFERVLDGLFSLVASLFDIHVTPADGLAPVWHPDVRFFRLTDSQNETLAFFYLDPYSRPETKRGGAWMNEFQTRERTAKGTMKKPIALMVCNQATPTPGKPSCMTPSEISTLFHEFGHALQHMLTQVDFPQASGINGIEWDAVEVASQFLENWSSQPSILKKLSQHYQTHEALDAETLNRIYASDTHHAALAIIRQLRFAKVDLELHSHDLTVESFSVESIDSAVKAEFAVMPPLPEDRFLCNFSHIFAGGYAAGYYSYLWADVLAADVFTSFLQAGIEDTDAIHALGQRYAQTFLAMGGAQPPMEVFKSFCGREPNPAALLQLKGL